MHTGMLPAWCGQPFVQLTRVIRLGFGQHGGVGRWEQSPVLLVQGDGFAAGSVRQEPTSVIDAAPTILRHLGMPADGMDGRALQAG